MWSRIIAFGALLLAVAIGFFRLASELREARDDAQFAHDYLERLGRFVQSRGRDMESYGWLTQYSVRMQASLGAYGWLEAYRRPFDNIVHNRAAVITTLLPELYSEYNNTAFGPYEPTVASLQQTLVEVLVRHLGLLEERDNSVLRELRNPFVWLREGVRALVFLPVSILGWLGVTSGSVARRISHSPAARVFAGLVAVVGLLSAAVTIVLGWDAFLLRLQMLAF